MHEDNAWIFFLENKASPPSPAKYRKRNHAICWEPGITSYCPDSYYQSTIVLRFKWLYSTPLLFNEV